MHLHLQALIPTIGFGELDQFRNGNLADVVQCCHSPNVFNEIRLEPKLSGDKTAVGIHSQDMSAGDFITVLGCGTKPHDFLQKLLVVFTGQIGQGDNCAGGVQKHFNENVFLSCDPIF